MVKALIGKYKGISGDGSGTFTGSNIGGEEPQN